MREGEGKERAEGENVMKYYRKREGWESLKKTLFLVNKHGKQFGFLNVHQCELPTLWKAT